jgi:hypothetical protein
VFNCKTLNFTVLNLAVFLVFHWSEEKGFAQICLEADVQHAVLCRFQPRAAIKPLSSTPNLAADIPEGVHASRKSV